MKKIFLILYLFVFELQAIEYKMVFEHSVNLNKNNNAILKLYEENAKSLASIPAKIIIEENNKKYTFVESSTNKFKYYFSTHSKDFPLFYFKNTTFNNQKNNIVNLVGGVNVFDIDNNGNNEVFVYGTSHYGGSGSYGKVLIFEKNKDAIILKAPIIEANDNYEIKYYQKENIIIVAQYIWRGNIEAHYGDLHRYKFYIYEINNDFKKIPIFLSKKKFNDENTKIIEDNLADILYKYSLYKSNKVSIEKEKQIILFVNKYWSSISSKNFDFINKLFNSKSFYYKKYFAKEEILKDKKRALKKVQKISFELNDFLVYKRGKKYIVEYIKSFDIDNGTDYGTVKSVLELKNNNNSFLILSERDIAILSLKKDFD